VNNKSDYKPVIELIQEKMIILVPGFEVFVAGGEKYGSLP